MSIEFVVHGRNAMFTTPESKLGGEKSSYLIPTYEAVKGIVKAVYWKPTLIWIVDEVRVMRRISTQSRGVKLLDYNEQKSSPAFYTYLRDVEYQVKAHFEFNPYLPEFKKDHNAAKHKAIADRRVRSGGCRSPYLGTSDCHAYVEPCKFGEGEGFYDNEEEVPFSFSYHGRDYPDENGNNELWIRYWTPVMRKGIIKFPRPDECKDRRLVRTDLSAKTWATTTKEVNK